MGVTNPAQANDKSAPVSEVIDFSKLVWPLSVTDFFDSYWEKKPLHQSSEDASRFDTLIGVDDVETLAAIGLSLPDAVSAVLAARCVDGKPDYWQAPSGVGPNVSIHALLHAFAEGYSIVLNSVDRYWSPLNELCRRIESVLQQPASANIYYSPGLVQAFPPHFDKFDVLVMQISGQKTWELFKPEPDGLSANADPWVVPSANDEPLIRAALNPGDVLYLPRGWSHRVRSQSQPSLHVTFGIRSLRWADLVMRAAQRAIDADDSLQKSVPLQYSPKPENINKKVSAMLEGLTTPVNFDPYASLMKDVLKGRLPSLVGQSQSITSATVQLDAGTMLCRRQGLAPLVTYEGDNVTIRFAGNGVTTEGRFGAALEFVSRSEQFTVGNLSSSANEDVDALVQSLILNGLLVIAPNFSN